MADSPFAVPALRRLLAARLCITLAIQSVSAALGWQVFAWTRDPLMLGLLGFAQFVPMMLLTPYAGHVVDRGSRRDLSAASIAGCALACAALTAASGLGGGRVAPLMVAAGLFGALRAFAGPSMAALVPELVPEELLPRALAVTASVFQFAMVFGPALGGFGIASLGATVTYAAAAGLLAGATLLLWTLPRRPPAARAKDEPARDLWAGLRFVRQKPVLLGAMSLDLFAVLLGGAVALLPAVAQEVLHVGPAAFGWLRSAPAVGAALTGLALSRWPVRSRVGATMLGAVALFGVATLGFGLARSFPVALACLAFAGACDMVSVVVRHSLIQLETPDAMRGRVSAVSQLFIGASNELGELESGVTARLFGVTPAILLGGAGTLLVVLTWCFLFPDLRRRERL